jgi:hypothetical protein
MPCLIRDCDIYSFPRLWPSNDVGIDALLDKGLRPLLTLEYHINRPTVGIDAQLDKGLRLETLFFNINWLYVGIDALFDKG